MSKSSPKKLLLIISQDNEGQVEQQRLRFYSDSSSLQTQTTEIATYSKEAKDDAAFQQQLANIPSAQYEHAIILAHGDVLERGVADNKEKTGESYHSQSLDVLGQIEFLIGKDIKNFHIVTCNGGALIHDL